MHDNDRLDKCRMIDIKNAETFKSIQKLELRLEQTRALAKKAF